MYKFFKNLSCLLCLIIIFGGCRKKAFDDYYGRPANLQPPIYQVLQARGNFTNLLSVIDKSGYKTLLSSGGFWTFFAPNDAAFQKYFTANSTTIDKIDSVTAGKIVRYCLVYNAFQTSHLADYQSPTGYVPNLAFKRRTTYYDGFMFGTTPTEANGVYVSENRNSAGYSYGDNNNKYIPYFYSTFMAQAGLTAIDYNYFFPNSTYSGFNVVNASVVNKDIIAENGVIHEIDQVVLPLPTIEQKLASNSQYSVFRNLYEQYLVSYVADANYTRQYNNVTNKNNTVYVKDYSFLLNFSLGNESFIKFEDNDSQKDGYTLFAPTNAALTPYLGATGVTGSLLEFYGTVASLPSAVLATFMNAHMFATSVWPSKFTTTSNSTGEPARFDPGLPTGTSATSNVIDKQFCSNGLFYGVNQVQQANVFSTVYARAYLDPAYSIMLRLLGSVKSQVTSPGLKFTIFMLTDATLQSLGYNYDGAYGNFTQTVGNVVTVGGSATTNLQRILNYCVVSTPNGELNNLSGDGIAETNGGEYIRWHNNTIANAASVETNTTLTINTAIDGKGYRDYTNGRVYYLTGGIPNLPNKSVSAEIAANAGTAANPGPYYDFYTYLVSSGAYNPAGGSSSTGEIIGVSLGVNYTVFIPTRAAMQQAVLDNILPGTYTTNPVTGVKTFVSFTYNSPVFQDKVNVTNFIQYHILSGTTIVPDGKKATGLGLSLPTLLKDQTGTALQLYLLNTPGAIAGTGTLTVRGISDSPARTANLIPQNANPLALPGQTSNYLGNYTVIHQIDKYLKYTF